MAEKAFLHSIQRDILTSLIRHPGQTFTELLGNKESSKFAYHIRVLEDDKFIERKDKAYFLSQRGLKLSAYLEDTSGKKMISPVLTHAILAEKDGKYLFQKRLKEPFFGHWNLVSKRVKFGDNLKESITIDLLEKTGLRAKEIKVVGLNQIKTFFGDELVHHHYLFYAKVTHFGALKERSNKGENAWLTFEEYEQARSFPSPYFKDMLSAEDFLIIESRRDVSDEDLVIKTILTY